MEKRCSHLAISKKIKQPRVKKNKSIFYSFIWETDLVQFIGDSTDDGLVSEVEMKPLKIHLPVNSLIAVCLRGKYIH